MKYICLGYVEPGTFENMSESDRNAMLDECFGYNDELRRNGHLVAEEQLQPATTAVTVSWTSGKVAVTDGPYAETKEHLGGIQVLEARDLNHAIALISEHPGVRWKCGTVEIRPAADFNAMTESDRRRRQGPRDEAGRLISGKQIMSFVDDQEAKVIGFVSACFGPVPAE